MRIAATCEVRGRGLLAIAYECPPRGIVPGVLIHQGDRGWRVRGVESGTAPKGTLGLLLHAEDVERYGVPEAGEVGL